MIEVTISLNSVLVKGHSFATQEPCARITGYMDCFKLQGQDYTHVTQSYGYTRFDFVNKTQGTQYLWTLFIQGIYQLAGIYKNSIKVYDNRERSK